MATTASTRSEQGMHHYVVRLIKRPPFKGNEEMQYEGVRLKTFNNWPNWAAVWPTLLAKAGFYYTGIADQVACFCCSGRLKTWEAGDSPLTEHKRFFPQCRFVTGQDSTNVPLGEAPEVSSCGLSSRPQTKSKYYVQLAKPVAGQCASLQYSATNEAPQGSLSMATGGTTGIASLTLQQLQDMKLESKRLESFTNWQTEAYACPANLAKAGLFYFDFADHVKCAFCNVTLRGWQPDDDPMEVHLKYFPTCAFIKDARAAGNVSVEEENINIQQASQNAAANPSPSSQLGDVPPEEPRSLNYSGETSRLLSFRRWPQNSNQSASDLAQASFYYTGACRFPVEARVIRARMDTSRVRSVLDTGFSHDLVYKVIEHRLTTTGDDFPNVQSLVEALLAAEEAAPSSSSSQPQHMRSTAATSTAAEPAAGEFSDGAAGNTPGARRFPVEARVIRARMDTSRVRSVLDTGFSHDLVYKVIEHRLTTTGDDFPNVQSLLEALLAAEEAAPSSSSSQPQHMRSTAATSTAAEPVAGEFSDRAAGNTPEARRFSVEARVIRARMDTSRVRSVLDMGFSRDLVYKVIEHRLTTTGDDFPNVQSLVEAVLAAEEAATSSSSSQPQHMRSTAATSTAAEPAAGEFTDGAAGNTPGDDIILDSMEAVTRNVVWRDQSEQAIVQGGLPTREAVTVATEETSDEGRLLCKICLDEEARALLLPCRHLYCCIQCEACLTHCCMCRAPIKMTFRVSF
ncbi:E3 ubiquitin-protein ligase XIAP [Lamellibrachia satsuma]|nr:E3 ubiquitin-protein ligase XIAP [Lamellibrachia satsuma]